MLPLSTPLLHFIPGAQLILTVAPIALVYAGFTAWLAGYLKVKRNLRTPYTRKVFHFMIFTMTCIIQLTWRLPGVTVLGFVVKAVADFRTRAAK